MPDYTIRAPQWQDASRVLALLIACDLAEYNDIDSSLDDLRHEWSSMDLSRDAWLIFAGETLVGYAAFSATGRTPHGDFYVHPAHREDGVRRLLLEAIVQRGRDTLMGAERKGAVLLRTIIPSVNARDMAAVRRAGFTLVKHYYRMQIELLDPPEAWTPPAGVSIRTMQPGVDDRTIYEVVDAAFAGIGRPERPFDAWKNDMMRAEQFDPDLWFLAELDGEVIGAALCFDYDAYGWVRQMGVLPRFQGRAVGRALINHAFSAFYDLDCLTVALGVDSENEPALRFYERLGMTRVRQYNEYGLRLA